MIMNETTVKTKKKIKPNVIDFLIILVVLGAIVGIALRAGVVEKVTVGNNQESARVSFLILDINDRSGDYFRIGDQFYSPTLKTQLGELESVQIMPAEVFISSQDGNLIKTYSNNNRIDVRGTFLCSGTFSDLGFLLGGNNYIAPGSTVQIQSPYIDVTMTVTDIERVETDN